MQTGSGELQSVSAHWEHRYEGFTDPIAQRLIALTIRLATLADPGFTAQGHLHRIAGSEDTDYMGASYRETVSRLGDDAQGLEVTNYVSDPHNGITPYSASTGIAVYGLPAGYLLSLRNQFNPRGADFATLTARLPAPAARQVGELLQREVNADVPGL